MQMEFWWVKSSHVEDEGHIIKMYVRKVFFQDCGGNRIGSESCPEEDNSGVFSI